MLEAVKAGATGYLVKSASREELLDAVRRVAAGDTVFTPGLAGLVLGEFRRMAERPPPTTPRDELTERETEMLKMVAKGLSYKQIAERLVLSHRTVQNHVQNTLRKLQMHNRVELTRYAIAQGLDEEPDAGVSRRRPTSRGLGLDSDADAAADSRPCSTLHRAHLERMPYENLGDHARPAAVRRPDRQPGAGRRRGPGRLLLPPERRARGRCCVDLGFVVSRRHGHVWTRPSTAATTVAQPPRPGRHGLPTDDNPGGHWWVDVGLGDGFAEPLPLVRGEHRVRWLPLRDRGRVRRPGGRPTDRTGGVDLRPRPDRRVRRPGGHRAPQRADGRRGGAPRARAPDPTRRSARAGRPAPRRRRRPHRARLHAHRADGRRRATRPS